MLLSIIHYFETNFHTLEHSILGRFQDDQGTALEEAVLLGLTRLLQNERQLGDIFEFYGELPPWANCKAQIVAQNPSGGYEAFSIDRPVIPTAIFACSAETPEEVTRWLQSGETGWCIPGRLMGPDLMARLRLSDGNFLLLVVQAKYRSTGNIDTISANVAAHAIRSLDPKEFFGSLVLVCDHLGILPYSLLTLCLFEDRRQQVRGDEAEESATYQRDAGCHQAFHNDRNSHTTGHCGVPTRRPLQVTEPRGSNCIR